MSSTKPAPTIETSGLPKWRQAGHRYYCYSYYLKQQWGHRVQKVSIDAGFTCPNVDGTLAQGGCTFCDNRSFSPSRRVRRQSITRQIDDGIAKLKRRYKCDHFLAYFQPATNTYAPVDELQPLYESALEHEKVVGLAIGTRPDCVPDEVLDLLGEFAKRTYLSVEYGVQTIHDRSLQWMNRGHCYDVFPNAVQRSRGRGFSICAHLILGLPDEDHTDMMATAREMARLELDAIKFHNLYAVKDTVLADQVAAGEVTLMERDDYVRTLVDMIEVMPPSMVIERVSGEAPESYFIGPSWCLDKANVLAAIQNEFERRDTWQGRMYEQGSCEK